MVMAGSLEYAKLVTATYLKQKWDTIKGFNKWYLTASVVILMAITSAGIFGYLSNAFQQQNIKLDQVAREIQVWQNKIDNSNQQIATLQGQQKDLSATQNTLITKGNVNSRLLRSVDNRDRQSNNINKKINVLQDSIVVYNGYINDIKNNNIELEREVGGFRFVADAFGMSLNSVVKFFIFLIVIVFDPLAIALVIAFNQLVLGDGKKEEEVEIKEDNTKEIIEEESRLKLSENDLKKLSEVLLNPPPPNDNLKEAAKTYNEQLENKEAFDEMLIKPHQPTPEERHEILTEMMKNDQELGLYEEPFDNSLIKEEKWETKAVKELEDYFKNTPQEEIDKLIEEINNLPSASLEATFQGEDFSNIEPTKDEEERNFSSIEPEMENIFQEEDNWTPELEQQFWEEQVPEPFATEEELKIDVTPTNEPQIETSDEETTKSFEEDNERMDIIGQNGNEGLHYDNEENTSSEQDDEKKN
jgi:septal ring factor EnvC (AmiA/AmiB activator)